MSLASAVVSIAPLEGQLARPIRLAVATEPRSSNKLPAEHFAAVARMFEAGGLRRPTIGSQKCGPTPLDDVATAALAVATVEPLDLLDPEAAMLRSGRWIRSWSADCLAVHSEQCWAIAPDGARLSTFQAGTSTLPPVLVFGPPGMPCGILAGWLERIAIERRVATWETRGLFGPDIGRPMSFGHEAHLTDAIAVLDILGWDDAHVIGFCGGAALALGFAATHGAKVRSLSLLFGDYELTGLAPKSAHQKNLQALMGMVVGGRVSAAQLQKVLLQSVVRMTEPDLAPFALYPYANPALLEAYCRINHAIMNADVGGHLPRIGQAAFVAFDRGDDAVHPEGSRVVAERIGAQFEAFDGPGHLGTFRGHSTHVEAVMSFLGTCEGGADALPPRRLLS